VELLSEEFVAEGLLGSLAPEQVRGKKFLIPRAETARDILPVGIVKMGGEVEVVPVYRTGIPSESDVDKIYGMLTYKKLDAVTFTSSSTVTHFVELLGRKNLPSLLDGVAVASIGPVTTATAKKNGLGVTVEAASYTTDGLIEALCRHFQTSATVD